MSADQEETSSAPPSPADHLAQESEAAQELIKTLPEEWQSQGQFLLQEQGLLPVIAKNPQQNQWQNWQQTAQLRWIITAALLLLALAFTASQWNLLLSPKTGFIPTLRPLFDYSFALDGEEPDFTLREDPQNPYTQKERLLQTQDWQALHDLEPENPIWHQRVVMEAMEFQENPPADWQQKWAQIDPDNGMLLMAQTMAELGNGTDEVYTMEKDEETDENLYTIHDPERFEAVRDQLYLALEKPRVEAYGVIQLVLASHFPQGKRPLDHPSQAKIKTLASLFSVSVPSTTMQLGAARHLAAEAMRAAEEEDEEAFTQALQAATRWIEHELNNEQETLIEYLVSFTIMRIFTHDFTRAAELLGKEEQAAQLIEFGKALEERKERMDKLPIIDNPSRQMSTLSAIAEPSVSRIIETRPPFVAENYAAGVREERAWGFSASLLITFVLLLILVIPLHWLARAANGSLRTQLSSRLLGLANWKHWLALALWSWALPLFLMLAARYTEPSSNLGYSLLYGMGYSSDLGHPLLIFLLVMPITRWWARKLLPSKNKAQDQAWLCLDLCCLVLALILAISLQALPHLGEVVPSSLFSSLSQLSYVLEMEITTAMIIIGLGLLLAFGQSLVGLVYPALKRQQTPLWLMASSHAALPLWALWAVSLMTISHFQQQEAGYFAYQDEALISIEKHTFSEMVITRQAQDEIRALWPQPAQGITQPESSSNAE